jgi:hypothetical protein
LVWPTHVRRRGLKHAFEQALDEARLDPDGQVIDDDSARASVTGPAIGSLGDIATASGYVARESLVRAYDAEGEPAAQAPPRERPGEAALRLKAALAGKAHTPAELRRMRRRFAAQNHPDSVGPELRAEALAAMAEINAEIDRALKRAEAGPAT